MSAAALRKIEDCQEALVSALDGDNIDALEQSIEALRYAVDAARSVGGWHDEAEIRARAEKIRALAHAAMIRVNFLTDMTRQRLDTLAALRGRPVTGYSKHR